MALSLGRFCFTICGIFMTEIQQIQADIEKELDSGSNLSIINLVNLLVSHAYFAEASDIHLDPSAEAFKIRFRIDGILQDMYTLPKRIQSEIISRIKILSGLRTDEHQAAQDGRFRSLIDDKEPVDVRVSVTPTFHGENAVLRLLADRTDEFDLEALGFCESDRTKILNAIKKPYGMILATGPTGSGKTTTLYTILKKLHTKDISIVTIEDPIEYAIDGIKQIQVNHRTSLTFANGLRSILRQDPNVIMVGEIRDFETANIAINTALTGHLLLSTLHTNDAITTLLRLMDMKIESFLIASTVNIAIGQRLVRKICPNCKASKKVTEAEKKSLQEVFPAALLASAKQFYHGKGCAKCNNTGYKNRIVINEVLVIDEPIREAIMKRATGSEIKAIAIQRGMRTMLDDGFEKAKNGVTTVEEVLRVIHE